MAVDQSKIRSVPLAPGTLADITVTAYPFRSRPVILSDVISAIEIRDEAEKCAVEVSFTIDNVDKVAHKYLAPGTWMTVQGRSPINGNKIHITPRLYVWERLVSDDRRRSATLTALDTVSFLQRQGQQSYFFRKGMKRHPKGWTASEIATAVLRDLGIPAQVVPTSYRINWFLLQDVTPYEAILKAYMRDKQITGQTYRIRAGKATRSPAGGIDIPGTVVIEPVLYQDYRWLLSDDQNILSAERSESLDDVATEYIGVVLNKDGKELARTKVSSPDKVKYGTLRRFEVLPKNTQPKDAKRVAQRELGKFRQLKRSARVEAIGTVTLRASDLVSIQDAGTGLNGNYFVSTISHSLSASGHQMEVELSYTAKYPTIEVEESEWNPSAARNNGAGDSADGTSGAMGERAVAWAATQQGVPYVYGGNEPGRGLDCSSLTMFAWKYAGKSIPRTTFEQIKIGQPVSSIANAAPGDLVFYGTGHMALYAGGGKQWEARRTGTRISLNPVRTGSVTAIRRPVPLSEQGTGTGSGGGTQSSGASTVKVPAVADEWQYASGQFSGGGTATGGTATPPTASSSALKSALTRRGVAPFLANLADTFIAAGSQYGIDPIFLAAIACLESGNGRYGPAVSSKNIMGYKGGPQSKSFPTYEACVFATAGPTALTGELYAGRETIAEIGARYAPPGASNDGGGNSRWPSTVSAIYRELGGSNPSAPMKGAGYRRRIGG